MTMQRWEPMREMMTLRNAMDRLFDDSFVRPARVWAGFDGEGVIPVDITQNDNDVVVKASMPGFKPEEVDIQITGDTLTIRGEHKETKEVKEDNYLCREINYGTVSRAITIPVDVKSDKAEATFENGVLHLNLPKAEEVKPKQIKVKASGS
ncbi:MAG: Hsp20/alpha crystallin family protein [Dehalococcoidales bacterium]|nr:Hsp20/alpha crystallin family protein [Dehalococcoidales bacterium]